MNKKAINELIDKKKQMIFDYYEKNQMKQMK